MLLRGQFLGYHHFLISKDSELAEPPNYYPESYPMWLLNLCVSFQKLSPKIRAFRKRNTRGPDRWPVCLINYLVPKFCFDILKKLTESNI